MERQFLYSFCLDCFKGFAIDRTKDFETLGLMCPHCGTIWLGSQLPQASAIDLLDKMRADCLALWPKGYHADYKAG